MSVLTVETLAKGFVKLPANHKNIDLFLTVMAWLCQQSLQVEVWKN